MYRFILSIAMLGLATAGCQEVKMTRSDMEGVCLGRITLDLPAARKTLNESGAVDDVSVSHVTDPQADWERMLNEEKSALMQSVGATDSVVTKETGSDNLWLARYRVNRWSKKATAVRALAFRADKVLRLDSRGDETVIDEVESAVMRVANALSPISHDSVPSPGSFCLPSGFAVQMTYQGYFEQAWVEYDLFRIGKLKIVTRTNGDDEPKPLRDIIASGRAEMIAAYGETPELTSLSNVRSREFAGQAAALSGAEKGRILKWRATGRARAPGDPFIEITLKTKDLSEDPEQLLGAIVASIVARGSGR